MTKWSVFWGCVLPLEETKTHAACCSYSQRVSLLTLDSKMMHPDAHRHIRNHVFLPLLWLTSVCALRALTIQCSIPHPSSLNATTSPHIANLPLIVRMHSTQWLLFIVHSFTYRASCLAWYSIILQPTLSFPAISPRDSSTTTLIVQHTGFIQTEGTASMNRISAFLRHKQTVSCSPLTEDCC